jgi:hypothetical protein
MMPCRGTFFIGLSELIQRCLNPYILPARFPSPHSQRQAATQNNNRPQRISQTMRNVPQRRQGTPDPSVYPSEISAWCSVGTVTASQRSKVREATKTPNRRVVCATNPPLRLVLEGIGCTAARSGTVTASIGHVFTSLEALFDVVQVELLRLRRGLE